jgi:hypothetical protein
MGGDGGQHRPAAQPVGGVVLVVHRQLHQHRGWRQRRPRPAANQVARLSAFTATGRVTRRTPSGARRGQRSLQLLFQQAHLVGVLAQAAAGLGGTQGWPRTTSAQPTRSSSSRTRCDTADGVTCSARAARSKLPSRTTAASANREG